MAKNIRLPDGELALLVDRSKLSTEFETEIECVSFWDKIKHRSTGKLYRRADPLLSDYTPEGHQLLVKVRKQKRKKLTSEMEAGL